MNKKYIRLVTKNKEVYLEFNTGDGWLVHSITPIVHDKVHVKLLYTIQDLLRYGYEMYPK